MSINFYVGEVQAQSSSAVAVANAYIQHAGTLKDSVNAMLSAPLSGETYKSAKAYFMAVYPPISSALILVGESMVEAHTKFPEKFQTMVDSCDVEEHRLKAQIEQGQNLLKAYAEVLNKEEKPNQRMEQAYMRMQEGVGKLEEKLADLYAFNGESAGIFAEVEANLDNLEQGLSAIENCTAWNPSSGTFDISKLNLSWTKPINEAWQKREEKRTNGGEFVVKEGKNRFGGLRYEVYRNGVFDEEATETYNEIAREELIELARYRMENDKFNQFVSLIGQTYSLAQGGKVMIREIIGIVGDKLIVSIDGNGVGALSLSGSGVVEGTISLNGLDVLLKEYGGNYMFSNNGKITSKTFGKPIEGRYGKEKVNYRVDAEPDSNNIHVQTKGGGKNSYKYEIPMNQITDKKSIYDLLPNIVRKGLGKGKVDEIVNNIWKAYIWIKT